MRSTPSSTPTQCGPSRRCSICPQKPLRWFFWALNAALLFVFVGYFLVTGLPKAFRSRRQQLDRQIVEARVATEKAEERLRAVEERLSRLD